MIDAKEVLRELRKKWIALNDDLMITYGSKYPKKNDFKGWEKIGQKEGISYAITQLEHVITEQ